METRKKSRFAIGRKSARTQVENRIVCFLVPLLILLIAASGCGRKGSAVDSKDDATIAAKLDAIRQAGQPVSAAELNAAYPEPSAGDNAAPLYAEAFEALAAEGAQSPSFLSKNQKALTLLHQAATKNQCRYPVDLTEGFNAKLPHLAKIRICAQLLEKDAAANAGKGRMDWAAQSVMDGLRLARSLDQEPLLISQLVRLACDAIVLSSLEDSLGLKAYSEEQLARLQVAFHGEAGAVGGCLTRALIGERCASIVFFQTPPSEFAKLSGSFGTNSPFGTQTEFERYRKSANFNVDFNLCLDLLSNWAAIVSTPFPECLEAASLWEPQATDRINEAKSKGCRISTLMLPTMSPQLEKVADRVGQLRAAEVSLAIERFRRTHQNALPDSLSQLASQFLEAVPADPYDGKPLRFKKLSPKSYVVYSVGRNRQDDGGTPKPSGGKADGPYDVAFTVRR